MLKEKLEIIEGKEQARMNSQLPKLPLQMIKHTIEEAFREDFGRAGDITTAAVIPESKITKVAMVTRQKGCLAGIEIAKQVFATMDTELEFKTHFNEGDMVNPNDVLLEVEGSAKSILMAERIALNFIGKMSGIASKTREMVDAVAEYKAKICSTRKTTPTLRIFEKYAVRAGGGSIHRLGLDDTILIKDNHIAMGGGIKQVLINAKKYVGHTTKIEIEVDTLEQLQEVLNIGIADIVMLDNMSNAELKQAVAMVGGRMITEASGGVNINTVKDIAATGVDMISVGAITHSAPCLDIGLDFIE